MLGRFNHIAIVLGTALLAAGLVAGVIHYKGGGEKIRVSKILLSPDMLIGCSQVPSSLDRHWLLQSVEYSDGQSSYRVSPERYAHIYDLIKSQRQIEAQPDQFMGATRMTLVLAPTSAYARSYAAKQVQVVEFAPNGKLFRIQTEKGWAYFFRPGIGYAADQVCTRGDVCS